MKKYTKQFFEECGRKGGEKTKERHGIKHFSRIRRKTVDKLFDTDKGLDKIEK